MPATLSRQRANLAKCVAEHANEDGHYHRLNRHHANKDCGQREEEAAPSSWAVVNLFRSCFRIWKRVLDRIAVFVLFGTPTALDLSSCCVFCILAIYMTLLSIVLRIVPKQLLRRSAVVQAILPHRKQHRPCAIQPSCPSTPTPGLVTPPTKAALKRTGPLQPAVKAPQSPPLASQETPQAPALMSPLAPPAPPPPVLSASTPAGCRPKPYLKSPSGRIRRLHWNKLPNKVVPGTVWQSIDKLDDLGLDRFISSLHKAFRLGDNRKRSSLDKESVQVPVAQTEVRDLGEGQLGADCENTPKKPTEEALLPCARAQVVLVSMFVFRSFEGNETGFISALRALSEEAFTQGNVHELETRLSALSSCVYSVTEEEIAVLRSYNGPLEQLRKAERWLHVLFSQVEDVRPRVRSWLCKTRFEDTFDMLERDVLIVLNSANALSNSSTFPGLLRVILEFGNMLNAGSTKGQTFGFRLSALRSLRSLRAAGVTGQDRGISFLDIVAEFVANEQPHLRNFIREFSSMRLAKRVDPNLLQEEIEKLRTRVLETDAYVKAQGALAGGEGDGCANVLGTFAEDAKARVRKLQEMAREALLAVEKSAVCFGEPANSTRSDQWFSLLHQFVVDFEEADQRVQNELERKGKTGVLEISFSDQSIDCNKSLKALKKRMSSFSLAEAM